MRTLTDTVWGACRYCTRVLSMADGASPRASRRSAVSAWAVAGSKAMMTAKIPGIASERMCMDARFIEGQAARCRQLTRTHG